MSKKFSFRLFNNPDIGKVNNRPAVNVLDSISTTLPSGNNIVIDGVTLRLGNRVLFTNLSDSSKNNKVYIVTKSRNGNILKEVFDSTKSEAQLGDSLFIKQGTVHSNKLLGFDGNWIQLNIDLSGTIETSEIEDLAVTSPKLAQAVQDDIAQGIADAATAQSAADAAQSDATQGIADAATAQAAADAAQLDATQGIADAATAQVTADAAIEGPASSIDNELVLFDQTTGKLAKGGSGISSPLSGELLSTGDFKVNALNNTEQLILKDDGNIQLNEGSLSMSSSAAKSVSMQDEATVDAVKAPSLTVQGSNKTAGTGDGGDLIIESGTSTGGLKGEISLRGNIDLQFPGDTAGYIINQTFGGSLMFKGRNGSLNSCNMGTESDNGSEGASFAVMRQSGQNSNPIESLNFAYRQEKDIYAIDVSAFGTGSALKPFHINTTGQLTFGSVSLSSSNLIAEIDGSLTVRDTKFVGSQTFDSTTSRSISILDEATADAAKAPSLTTQASNKTAGTGNGGDLVLKGGTSVGGQPGKVSLPGWLVSDSNVSTSDATLTTIQSIQTNTNSVQMLECRVSAFRTGGVAGAAGDSAYYLLRARVKNNAGVVTVHNLIKEESEDQAAWDTVFEVSAENILVKVQGNIDNNVNWSITSLQKVGQ